MHRRLSFLALAATAVLAAGCAASSGGGGGGGGGGNVHTGADAQAPSTSTSSGNQCSPANLHTETPGELTVATDSPAYPPWFLNDKPSNGKGFESAVAYAVAKQLGYSASKVKWVVAPFNSVIAPTPKHFDFDINEVSITPQRAQAVDFSSGYYDVAQAIVALKTDKYAHAKSIAALRGAKLGAQQGTTSFDAINNDIKPTSKPLEYPTNILAVQALKNGTIDGLVVDLPTALYITAAQVHGSTIVGQLPVHGKPEQFGLVLDKGSSLTPCVTQAVNALRKNGTLAKLQKRWLTTAAGAPVLH
jgi:polar amino acid transport system substrate-binding protein